MNYQYIEQLIERYFECQTTLHEEQILRTFFAGEDVPGHLMPYTELFQYPANAGKEILNNEFDRKMLALVQKGKQSGTLRKTKTRELPTDRSKNRLTPFFRAAAIVAIALTVGRAADHALNDQAAGKNEDATAISPYIRQADIQNAIRIKDISQAEAKPQTDSLIVQPLNENMQ
ncbi:MAG: pyruvate ferredoxin oxidoreductase [Bacteroidaceae bacterium]|nr:pyruvate ferredoxin oxidoreductase [Bacteroidaceae bacterium]